MARRRDEASSSGPVEINLTNNRDLNQRKQLFDIAALLAVSSLIGAIATGRPEVVALGSPFLIAIALALALWRPADGRVTFDVSPRRVVEGDDVTVTINVRSDAGIDRIEIELSLEPDNRLSTMSSLRTVTSLRPGSETTIHHTMTADEWGVADLGMLTIRTADRFAMFGGEIVVDPQRSIRIGLPEARLRASLEADRFRRIVGSHLSNDRGQGLEIADIRPFQPGDSTRQINWRISNRRQEPWVTLRHPDRSTTVVVIVDAHDGDDHDQLQAQRRSVGAAMALARGHLAMHDRVGLLVVGHTLKWLPPRLGRNQLFDIADQLVAVGNAPGASLRMYRPPAVSSIPTDAIVVAISPLLDPLMVALVGEIRSRGNPVSALVPVTPDAPRRTRIARRASITRRTDEQACRLAAAEHTIGIRSLRDRGVSIVEWSGTESVLTMIESMQRLRSSMARARSW